MTQRNGRSASSMCGRRTVPASEARRADGSNRLERLDGRYGSDWGGEQARDAREGDTALRGSQGRANAGDGGAKSERNSARRWSWRRYLLLDSYGQFRAVCMQRLGRKRKSPSHHYAPTADTRPTIKEDSFYWDVDR